MENNIETFEKELESIIGICDIELGIIKPYLKNIN